MNKIVKNIILETNNLMSIINYLKKWKTDAQVEIASFEPFVCDNEWIQMFNLSQANL